MVTNMNNGTELAFVSDWLAHKFLHPIDIAEIHAVRSAQGKEALAWIGEVLDEAEVVNAIYIQLSKGDITAVMAVLQRQYTMLFEGVFRQHNVLPYASAWDGTGHLFGPAIDRMQVLLTMLNVHVPKDCSEPVDHIAIQLACLAEALRQNNQNYVYEVLKEMESWVNRFTSKLINSEGFYGNAGRLLIALLNKTQIICTYRNRHDATASVALA